MSMRKTTCKNCGIKLKIEDGNCYPGGIKDFESISCPNCGHELFPIYTSGIPEVFYDNDET